MLICFAWCDRVEGVYRHPGGHGGNKGVLLDEFILKLGG